MRISLYATFRQLAGQKSLAIESCEGCTVSEVIQKIVANYPALREPWLNTEGELHAHVHVFLNGAEVPTLPEGFETHISASDELDFFPPVAGGAIPV